MRHSLCGSQRSDWYLAEFQAELIELAQGFRPLRIHRSELLNGAFPADGAKSNSTKRRLRPLFIPGIEFPVVGGDSIQDLLAHSVPIHFIRKGASQNGFLGGQDNK